jgi:SAM-dependent methyltransferase
VATSIESIEHVFDPEKYIRSIHDALGEDGILVLTTPNVEGFDLLLLKDKSDNTAAPDHINYFHPESITLLLERSGFKVMEILTPGKLDVELVQNKVLEGRISLDENPFLKRVIVDDYEALGASFQCWLANNGLSSHMWVVARKTR